MKKILLFCCTLFINATLFSQTTATNFTANDCAGTPHDLFSELDSGKVIVMCWVMPCGACTGNAKTSYNVAMSYASSYPGRVLYYLIDDYGNTNCTSITSWGNSNSLTNAIRFSNASIKMTNYGTLGNGMPKVVVVGGKSHAVWYETISSINTTTMQNAIQSGLDEGGVTGLSDGANEKFSFSISPNPANNNATISLNLAKSSEMKIELYNIVGNKVSDVFIGTISKGKNKFNLNTSELIAGVYFVKLSDAERSSVIKIAVTH